MKNTTQPDSPVEPRHKCEENFAYRHDPSSIPQDYQVCRICGAINASEAINRLILDAKIKELEWHRNLAVKRLNGDPERNKDAATTIRLIDERLIALRQQRGE